MSMFAFIVYSLKKIKKIKENESENEKKM